MWVSRSSPDLPDLPGTVDVPIFRELWMSRSSTEHQFHEPACGSHDSAQLHVNRLSYGRIPGNIESSSFGPLERIESLCILRSCPRRCWKRCPNPLPCSPMGIAQLPGQALGNTLHHVVNFGGDSAHAALQNFKGRWRSRQQAIAPARCVILQSRDCRNVEKSNVHVEVKLPWLLAAVPGTALDVVALLELFAQDEKGSPSLLEAHRLQKLSMKQRAEFITKFRDAHGKGRHRVEPPLASNERIDRSVSSKVPIRQSGCHLRGDE